MEDTCVVDIRGVTQIFDLGKVQVPALHEVTLKVNQGEFVALVGTSGSGKSTLLNILGGLCKSTAGEVLVQGQRVDKMTEEQLCLFRRAHIGFVFQSYNLLPGLTALENAIMPLLFSGMGKKERLERGREILGQVGLADRMGHRPNELSGGQQQRVSIARALINNPAIVLADEPTGNLDSTTGIEIMDLMRKTNREMNATFIVVTHDEDVARYANRTIHLKDGRILRDETKQEAQQ